MADLERLLVWRLAVRNRTDLLKLTAAAFAVDWRCGSRVAMAALVIALSFVIGLSPTKLHADPGAAARAATQAAIDSTLQSVREQVRRETRQRGANARCPTARAHPNARYEAWGCPGPPANSAVW
jgi:hypothetical protein